LFNVWCLKVGYKDGIGNIIGQQEQHRLIMDFRICSRTALKGVDAVFTVTELELALTSDILSHFQKMLNQYNEM